LAQSRRKLVQRTCPVLGGKDIAFRGANVCL
jgi:hypothetical protein